MQRIKIKAMPWHFFLMERQCKEGVGSWRSSTLLHLDVYDNFFTMLTHLQKVESMTWIWHLSLVCVNCHWSWTPRLRHQAPYIRKNIYFQIFVPNSGTLRYVILLLQFLWVSPCIFTAITRAEYEWEEIQIRKAPGYSTLMTSEC